MEEVKSELITIKIEPGIEDESCKSYNDGGNSAMADPLPYSGENLDSLERLDIKKTGNDATFFFFYVLCYNCLNPMEL